MKQINNLCKKIKYF